MQMRPFSIYYLIDPTTQDVRYIGYSRNPEKRYITHVLQAANKRTHKECWIALLLGQGLYPTLSIRCVVQGAEEAKRIEIALIASLRRRGIDLVNSTAGGDGSAGTKWSEESKRKAALIWTAERRQAFSAYKKGVPQTKKHIAAVMAANTPELLARRGASIKAGWARRNGAPTKKKGKPSGRQPRLGSAGWKMTPEQRQHQRDSWTPERRAIQAQRMRDRFKTQSTVISETE